MRLDVLIARHLPELSRAQAQKLIRDGHVRVSTARAKPALAVVPGWTIDVEIPAPTPARPAPQALPLSVLADDADIVVVDKAPGVVVHPAAGHASGTLVNALLHHVSGLSGVGGEQRPGIVHRLDRGTSGVMVIAKHDRAHRALAKQFHDREVRKEYLALVWGTPKVGTSMDQPIGRHPRHRKKMSSRARRARPALTRVLDVEPFGGVSLVRLAIGTGRTHQIRVHFSEAGHPVVGDDVYGGVRRQLPTALAPLAALDRPFLHAATLGFVHPGSGQPVTYEAPLAPDLASIIARPTIRTRTGAVTWPRIADSGGSPKPIMPIPIRKRWVPGCRRVLRRRQQGARAAIRAHGRAKARRNCNAAQLSADRRFASQHRAVQEVVFGANSEAVKNGRIVTVQTLGGTGGLKVGADLLRRLSPSAEAWMQRSELGESSRPA